MGIEIQDLFEVIENNTNSKQTKLLFAACKDDNSDLQVIKKIVTSGVNINAINAIGKTPLINAIEFDRKMSIISFLIQSGANVFARDKKGKSVFEYLNNYKLERILLAKFNDNSKLEYKTLLKLETGLSELIAIGKCCGHVGLCSLKKFLNEEIPQCVVKDFLFEIINNSIRLFSDSEIKEKQRVIEFLKKWKKPFMVTSQEMDAFEKIHCLIKREKNIDNKKIESRVITSKPSTELYITSLAPIKHRNTQIKKKLSGIISIVNVDTSPRSLNERLLKNCGNTKTTLDTIKNVLESGADPNAKDVLGMTSLLKAIETNKDIFIIRLLIQAGANVFVKDNKGKSAFEYFKNYKQACWVLAEYSNKSYLSWSTYTTMVVSYLPALIAYGRKSGGSVGLKYLDHYLDSRIPAPIAKDFMVELMNNNVRLFSNDEIEEEKGILKFFGKWNSSFMVTPREIKLFESIHSIELCNEIINNKTIITLEDDNAVCLNNSEIKEQANNPMAEFGDKERIKISNQVKTNETLEDNKEIDDNLVKNNDIEPIVEYLRSIRTNLKKDDLGYVYIDNNTTVYCDKCGKEFPAISGKRCPFCSKKINTEIWILPDKFFVFFYNFKGKDFLLDVKQSHSWIDKHFIGEESYKKTLKDIVFKLGMEHNKLCKSNESNSRISNDKPNEITNEVLDTVVIKPNNICDNRFICSLKNSDFFKDFDNSQINTILKNAILVKSGIDIISNIIEARADVNFKDNFGNTPLFYAVTNSDIPDKIINLLLENGADINVRNYKMQIPLMWAAKYSMNPDIIKYLIKKGANVFSVDCKKKSSLDYLKENNNLFNIISIVDSIFYSKLKTMLNLQRNVFPKLVKKGLKQGYVSCYDLDKLLPNDLPTYIIRDFLAELLRKKIMLFADDEVREVIPVISFLLKWKKPIAMNTAVTKQLYRNGHLEDVFKCFANLDESIDAKDDNGKTLLMYAASLPIKFSTGLEYSLREKERIELIDKLIGFGASLFTKDNMGRNVLQQLEKSKKNPNILSHLLNLKNKQLELRAKKEDELIELFLMKIYKNMIVYDKDLDMLIDKGLSFNKFEKLIEELIALNIEFVWAKGL